MLHIWEDGWLERQFVSNRRGGRCLVCVVSPSGERGVVRHTMQEALRTKHIIVVDLLTILSIWSVGVRLAPGRVLSSRYNNLRRHRYTPHGHRQCPTHPLVIGGRLNY